MVLDRCSVLVESKGIDVGSDSFKTHFYRQWVWHQLFVVSFIDSSKGHEKINE